MPKKIVYIIFLLCCIVPSQAQTCDTASFQRAYWFDNTYTSPAEKAVADPGGNVFIATNTVIHPEVQFSKQDAVIIKTNKRGTVLWSKRYGYSRFDDIMDIVATPDGGVIAVGMSKSYSGLYDGEGWMFKINGEGDIVWALDAGREYSDLSKIVALKNGDYAVSGQVFYDYQTDDFGNFLKIGRKHPYIILVSNDGKVKWTKEFVLQDELSVPVTLIPLNDSNFIFVGYQGYGPNHNNSREYMVKLSSFDGNSIWQQVGDIYPIAGKELPNGDIRLYTFINQDGVFGIFQTDKDGNVKWSKKFTLNTKFPFLWHIENTSTEFDEDVFVGLLTDGRALDPVLFKLKDTSRIEEVHRFSSLNPDAYIFNPNAFYFNNQFNIAASLKFDYPSPIHEQAYIIQTDGEGNTQCSSNYQLSIINSQADYSYFSTQIINSTQFNGKTSKVPVYAILFLPNQKIDCYKATCCRDTTVQNNIAICKGNSYALPGGKLVDSTSLYINVLKSNTGCDSVIYTNLYVKQPLKISLGDDTCLQDNKGLTYTLSYAPQHVQYLWQNGSTDSVYKIYNEGIYTVQVTDQCTTASDTLIVYKTCTLPIYMPTGFTPNNDGLNDVYHIPNMNHQKLINFSLYNRFGERIFSTGDASKGWDGTIKGRLQPTGTFIYYIIYKDLQDETHSIKGSFVLVR